MKRRRIPAVILALVFAVLSLSGCGGGSASPGTTPIISTPAPMEVLEAQQGSRLFVALCGESGSLNPLTNHARDVSSFLGLIFEGLIDLDANGEIQPALASSWSHDESGKVWTFHLRTQVQWHSGGNLTPKDVIETLNLIREIGSSGPYYYVVEALRSWKAVDDDCVQLSFKNLSLAGLYLLDFPIVPAGKGYSVDSAPTTLPGSGPYRISEIIKGESITLTRSERWWKVSPSIESVCAVMYPDQEGATSALSLRQVDVVETSSTTTDQYKYGNNASVFEYTTRNLECLFINNGIYILQNRYVRQAISYALDRSSIAESAYVRHAVVVDSPISPSGPFGKGTMQYVYDPEQAQRIIARTGWKDKDGDGILDTTPSGAPQKFTLRLVTSDSSQREDAARTIADELTQLGMEIDLRILPWNDYLEAVENGEYDLLLAGVHLNESPDLSVLLGTDGKLNYSRWTQEETQTALERVRAASESEELSQSVQSLRTHLLDEQPVICLYYRTHSLLLSSHVRGVACARQGDAYCDIEQWELDRSEE